MCNTDPPTTRINEPFRLFFPTGMLFGMLGVALWPLFFAGWLGYYPSFAHPRLMTQGFAGFFIFGFMMTAGPRLIGATPFSSTFILLIYSLSTLACLSTAFNHIALGDTFFALAAIALLFRGAIAGITRKDMPPPGFPLAALGLACAFFGSLLLAVTQGVYFNTTAFTLAKILLYQAFPLLPIVGVGAFFFPKILGGGNRHDFDEMAKPDAAWKRRFNHSLMTAVGFALSVGMEVAGYLSTAYVIRILALGSYVLSELPWCQFRRKHSMHGIQLIIALGMTGIGLLGAACFPAYKIAWLHAYFITGLTGVIFLVSLRVIFGHNDRPDLIRKSVKLFCWITIALVLATGTRIVADFRPDLLKSHYIYAATIWLLCGIVWLGFVAPQTKVTKETIEE